MNKEERITYEEFMIMFKNAPRIAYTLYDKAEDEIERLNNIIKEALNYIDDNTYYKDHKGHINIDDLYIILQGEEKMKDLDKKKLLNILIKKLDDNIGMYDYYSEEGHILSKIEQILNIIKVMNDEIPFEDWYLEELLQGEDNDKD